LISAGMAGVKEERPLTIVTARLSHQHSASSRLHGGYGAMVMTKRMPTSLKMSLESARPGKDWVATELFTKYLNVKIREVEYFATMRRGPSRKASQILLVYIDDFALEVVLAALFFACRSSKFDSGTSFLPDH
jgi:hypothetical protein